jgi:hypothetical protein
LPARRSSVGNNALRLRRSWRAGKRALPALITISTEKLSLEFYSFASGCTASGHFAGEPLKYQAPAERPTSPDTQLQSA